MTRALEPSEAAVFGVDAIIGPDNVPISRSSLELNTNLNHLAALEKARAKVGAGGEIPSVAQLKELLALFRDTTDGKAHAARVEKLMQVANDARAAVVAAGELDTKRLKHLALMADERARHERALEAESAKFEADRAAKLSDVTAREVAVAKAEAELKSATAKLAEQIVDVEKRLGLIRQAAR